ncbi:hypothetical protein HDU84_007925 [Entophlyctis sp. JEL0112]|nr:hypothetical protein HDU84_007925 [Entophlyctis sp. JEL0112]
MMDISATVQPNREFQVQSPRLKALSAPFQSSSCRASFSRVPGQGDNLVDTTHNVLNSAFSMALCDSKFPKALLPISNKPMLFYQLEWFESAMVNDIIIVSEEDSHKKITSYVYNVLNVSERYPNAKVEVVKGNGTRSADALRHIANRIKTDFIVMCCDTITNYPPSRLLDVFRIQSPTCIAVFHEPSNPDDSVASQKKEKDEMLEFVGIDHSTCRLLFAVKELDLDGEHLSVRMAALDQFPVLNIHTKLRDAQLYVFKHWVADYVAKSKFQSIKTDLLPVLTRIQYSEKTLISEGIDKHLTAPSNTDRFYGARTESSTGGGFVGANRSESMAKHYVKTSTVLGGNNGGGRSAANSAASSAILLNDDEVAERTDFHKHIVCTALVAKEGICFRANTNANYLDGCRSMIKTVPPEDLVPRSVERQKGCQVGDSMIGEGTRIGEKTGIKKSIIGNHCVIGKNVKISNSILMDYCVIEDRVVLEGTIVCNNAKVQEQCNLKDCQVSSNYTVEKEINERKCFFKKD